MGGHPLRQKNERPLLCMGPSFSRRAWLRMRSLFDSGSGAAASEDAQHQSHPLHQQVRHSISLQPETVECLFLPGLAYASSSSCRSREGSLVAIRHQISQSPRSPLRRSGTVILEQQKLMTKEEAVPVLRNFFTRMHDDSQRNSGF